MKREYHKWKSTSLGRDMELLVFGFGGKRIIFFPTRRARFYDYENWGVINALKDKINIGQLQVFCVDSIDAESFYHPTLPPEKRILRHIAYENYILNEVIPFSKQKNSNGELIIAGCSLGAYHAVNLAFRHPSIVQKVVGMSGRYDLTQAMGVFKDLFQGYVNEDIQLNTPNYFIPKIKDARQLQHIKNMEIIIAIGKEDAFLQDNRYLNRILNEKAIPHKFFIWEGEAHHPAQWRQMVQWYF